MKVLWIRPHANAGFGSPVIEKQGIQRVDGGFIYPSPDRICSDASGVPHRFISDSAVAEACYLPEESGWPASKLAEVMQKIFEAATKVAELQMKLDSSSTPIISTTDPKTPRRKK